MKALDREGYQKRVLGAASAVGLNMSGRDVIREASFDPASWYEKFSAWLDVLDPVDLRRAISDGTVRWFMLDYSDVAP